MNKYGFIKDEILPEHYRFGDAQIAAQPLQPTGQWDEFLPPDEEQNLNGIEPYACTSFGTLNCIETLLRRLFKDTDNYSDRYLATITGTADQHGNSPHFVAEYLRKGGCVLEALWPFGPDINTFDKFYAAIPTSVDSQAHEFVDHFGFLHDWVKTDAASLKDALRYSPIGISVFAWQPGPSGYYVKPAGASDNHWCCLYGYEDGVCWHVFDSYDNTHKKLAWDFKFEQAKRYSIQLAPPVQNQLSQWVLALKAALAWLLNRQQPTTPPVVPQQPPIVPFTPPAPQPPKEPLLDTFCEAIADYEGGPNDLNHKNNNPGNLRSAATQIGTNHGFAVFKTWADGMDALKALITRAAKGQSPSYKPDMNFVQFFSVYSPTNDGNRPTLYAQYVARKCQVDPGNFPIKNLIA